MTGHQFEVYYAQLLESLGWTRIRVTGDKPELNGALAHEHPHRLGMIVTTSRLTPPAEQLAARTGIRVVARPALASQMALVRDAADRRSGRAATAAPAAELP